MIPFSVDRHSTRIPWFPGTIRPLWSFWNGQVRTEVLHQSPCDCFSRTLQLPFLAKWRTHLIPINAINNRLRHFARKGNCNVLLKQSQGGWYLVDWVEDCSVEQSSSTVTRLTLKWNSLTQFIWPPFIFCRQSTLIMVTWRQNTLIILKLAYF